MIRLTPAGERETWLSEPDEAYVDAIEGAFVTDALTAAHMASPGASPLRNVSSLAFAEAGGTAYLGSLQSDALFSFRVHDR